MLNLILGGSGTGKSRRLIDETALQIKKGKHVFVIVPEQFSFEYDKKLYYGLGAENFNKIKSLSFTSLAKEIFEKYGGCSGEYADDISKQVIMYRTVQELKSKKAFMYFSKQAESPDFVSDALRLVSEFRQSGVGAQELITKINSSDTTLREKLLDIATLYFAYDSALRDNNLKDSLTDITESAVIANINDYFEGSVVMFDEFESFTGDEHEMIKTIIAQADEVFAAFRSENLNSEDCSIFDSVNKTCRRMLAAAQKYKIKVNTVLLDRMYRFASGDIEHLSRNILRTGKAVFENSESIKIVECTDLYGEAEYICAEIKRLVMSGLRYSDIVVTSRQLSDYVYIFESIFDRYEIPYYMHINKSVMHTALMQLVSGIFEVISSVRPSSESIFRLAKTMLGGISVEEVSRLENYCFEWDIDGDMWLSPFENAPDIEKTRRQIIEPLIALKENCFESSGGEICKSLYEYLVSIGAEKNFIRIIRDFKDRDMQYMAKEQKRIWDMFVNALDKVAQTCGREVMKPADFCGLFEAVLSQIKYSVPPQTLDGVKIVKAETARFDSPKVTFIAGVNEDIFPMSVSQGGLLNESDRLEFESMGLSLSRSSEELAADEKLIVYKAVSSPSEKLYMLYPLSDSRGISRYPSYVIKQTEEMFTNDIKIYAKDMGVIFYCPTIEAAYYYYVQHMSENTPEIQSLKGILAEDDFYSSRISYLESVKKSDAFQISEKDIMKRLYSKRLNISATGFEEYNLCPFKFFCRTGLNIKPLQRREINAAEQGSIIHKCLEKLLSSCRTKAEFESLDKNKIEIMISSCADEYLSENLGGEKGKTSRFKGNYKRLVSSITEIVLHLQQELSQSEFFPVSMEFDITEANGGLPVLTTDSGIEIIIRGIIDRVDMYEKDGQKYIRIVDYKTGNKEFSLGDLLYGINMQMIIYLYSALDKNGKFRDALPAGVLYMPAGAMPCSLDRNSEESIETALNKRYKMKGIVLNNNDVLSAMDKGIRGIYIPAKALKDMSLDKRSSVLDLKQFALLKKYTQKVLEEMADSLYSGNIAPFPLQPSSTNICKYCDYWSVCGNDGSIYRTKLSDKEAEKLLLSEITEEDENEKVDC